MSWGIRNCNSTLTGRLACFTAVEIQHCHLNMGVGRESEEDGLTLSPKKRVTKAHALVPVRKAFDSKQQKGQLPGLAQRTLGSSHYQRSPQGTVLGGRRLLNHTIEDLAPFCFSDLTPGFHTPS